VRTCLLYYRLLLLIALLDLALEILHDTIAKYRSPPEGRTRDFGQDLARSSEEPRYLDSLDALNLMDLNPVKKHTGVDSVRLLLQRLAPD
jgi:hypothetical protein